MTITVERAKQRKLEVYKMMTKRNLSLAIACGFSLMLYRLRRRGRGEMD